MKLQLAVVLIAAFAHPAVQAAGKAPPKEPSRGKRMIALDHVDQVEIQMPDGTFYPFGEGYCARMETTLVQSGKYNVHWPLDVENCRRVQEEAGTQVLRSSANRGDNLVWAGSSYPIARVRVKVKSMNFTTGWKGEQIFSGFDERNRSHYNSGFNPPANEFPLKSNDASVASPNWFDHHFDGKGEAPYDSRAGLDLGDGFSLNFLFVWLAVKYARYSSDLALQIEVMSELLGKQEYRDVRVGGEGFFFDVSGAYLGYSAGIQVARKDAMNQAFDAAIEASMAALDRTLKDYPLAGKIDHVFPPGTVHAEPRVALGTGFKSDIPVGTIFYVREAPGVELEALLSNEYGTVMRVKRGDYRMLRPEQIALQKAGEVVIDGVATQRLAQAAAAGPELTGTENIQLPWTNFKEVNFQDGLVPSINIVTAFFKSLVGLIHLPYRIWRYSMYDRPYQAQPDSVASPNQDNGGEWNPPMDPQRTSRAPAAVTPAAAASLNAWIDRLSEEPWATRIGWRGERAQDLDQRGVPVIAILDTGVDYNHPVLHANLNVKPDAPADPRGRRARYGWDFVSGDSRAADDHYHGTELASLAIAIAPNARYLPVKIFSPYGITSSASIYSAFEFAVDQGADIILCGWATRKTSQAIEDGVAYAQAHGVLVVAAAGDRGRSFANNYYPATLAKKYDNVLPVFGVDAQDRFAATPDFSSNFGTDVDGIAAPGMEMDVANPRGEYAQASSTSHAAALVAGAVARKLASVPAQDARPTPRELVEELLSDADSVPALAAKVKGGKRLRLR